MKLSELKALIDRIAERHPRDIDRLNVVVPITKPSIGGAASVPVTQVYRGSDWDGNTVFLKTDARLAPKEDKEEIYDMAYDLLFSLYQEGYHKKRKPWWYHSIVRIYERRGVLDKFEEYAKKFTIR